MKPILRQALIISLTLLGLVLLSPAVTLADELSDNEAQLKAVTEQLSALQKALAAAEQQSSSEQKALRSVETELGVVQRNVNEIQRKLLAHNQSLVRLEQDQKRLTTRLADKEADIQAMLRLAYKRNNQPLIKLLLSGDRPETLSRQLYYFSQLTATQQDLLTQWLDDHQQLTESITAEQNTLQAVKREQQLLEEQQQKLVTQKNRRAQVVADLNSKAKDTQAEIERKQSEREKLGELIAQLKARVAEYDLDFPAATEVGKVKGKLPWPVEGRLLNRYGRSINGSALNWQGWLIGSSDGTPVKAVHGGRILFADFFKSNGLLIIVDHGDGVWTLYGRNQTLLKDVGSWVDAGEIIAEVGRSGGYSESGLYFEVRYKGEPQNPATWLQKK